MDPLTLAIGIAIAIGLLKQLERETAHIKPPPKPHYNAARMAKLLAEHEARKAEQEKFDYRLTGWLMLIGVGAIIVGIVLS